MGGLCVDGYMDFVFGSFDAQPEVLPINLKNTKKLEKKYLLNILAKIKE